MCDSRLQHFTQSRENPVSTQKSLWVEQVASRPAARWHSQSLLIKSGSAVSVGGELPSAARSLCTGYTKMQWSLFPRQTELWESSRKHLLISQKRFSLLIRTRTGITCQRKWTIDNNCFKSKHQIFVGSNLMVEMNFNFSLFYFIVIEYVSISYYWSDKTRNLKLSPLGSWEVVLSALIVCFSFIHPLVCDRNKNESFPVCNRIFFSLGRT